MADDDSGSINNTPPEIKLQEEEMSNKKDNHLKNFTDIHFANDDSEDDEDIFKEKKRTDSLLVATSGDFDTPSNSEKDSNVVSFSKTSANEKPSVIGDSDDDDDDDVEKNFFSFKEKSVGTSGGSTSAAVVHALSIGGQAGKKISEVCLEDVDLIEIIVSDSKKVGDGMNAYVSYKVSTKTNSKRFVRQELSVLRRFSDFLGLYERLVANHQHLGRIVPIPPEKDMFGMTRVKMTKEETGSLEFVERRRAALERFLMRIARHPDLSHDQAFVEFLQVEGELPRVSGVNFLSGAGLAKFIGKVGDSINKMTYTLPESDQWFEDKNETIELLERYLQELHASLEMLVIQRKDLAVCTNLMSKSVANFGSTEEDLPLSRVLSSLAENMGKVEKIHMDQADLDFYSFSELFKDNLLMINAIRFVMDERLKVHKQWKDAEATLQKKKDTKVKLENQKKTDKLEFASIEISEWEEKVSEYEKKFNEISDSIKKEMERLDKMRKRDIKATIISYLQAMAGYQQQISDIWEGLLPEVKRIK